MIAPRELPARHLGDVVADDSAELDDLVVSRAGVEPEGSDGESENVFVPLYIDNEVYTLRGLTFDVCYETNGLDLDKDLVGRRMGDEEAQYE